jgi:hypothetical protein
MAGEGAMGFDAVGWVEVSTVIVTVLLVVAVVLLHYEALSFIGHTLKRRSVPHRVKILAMVFALLVVHVAEIWLFSAGYFALALDPAWGGVAASTPVGFLDLVYFSAITYTTVGYGDFVPTGALRFLCGMEALSGFVLITWSASFMFIEMQRYWGRD